MTKVIVVGSINVDLCCYLDRWPRAHETVFAQEFRQYLGGKGANQAVAAARLGADVTFIGAIGHAAYARFAQERLAAENMALNLVEFPQAPTGMAFIDIAPNSDNMIRLVGGANTELTPEDILARHMSFRGASVCLLQNEVPIAVSCAAAKLARQNGAMVVMDPAPSPPEPWDRDILNAMDVFTPNAVEAALYCGFVPDTPETGRSAALRIADQLGCSAVVTMGGNGVAWTHAGASGWLDVPHVIPVDTVGAGDCFNGAFATALVDGSDWPAAIQFALNAASVSTTRRGAMSAFPSRAEVNKPFETA